MADVSLLSRLGDALERGAGLQWPAGGEAEWAAVGALINLAAAVVALAAILHAIRAFRKEINTAHYTEIDKLYFELLSLKANSQKCDGFADIYPLMVWNFIETIVDRCDARGETRLYGTWEPVIRADGLEHLEWFTKGGGLKFKKSFRCWVARNFLDRRRFRPKRLAWRLRSVRIALVLVRPRTHARTCLCEQLEGRRTAGVPGRGVPAR